MPAQVAEPTVRAEFHGDVSGQVAIGNNNLQINQMYGGVVYHLAGGQTAVPRPIPTPVYLRPRRFPGLLDRQVERQTAQETTKKALPVQFYSNSGWGKTSLLRYLAYHLDGSLYPDGIVYQRVAGMGLDDICQVLFDLFYESDIPVKPAPGQMTRHLQKKQALVLLDDIDLPREDMEGLMDIAPRCTFLFASPENTIWHEGKAIQVKGLPEEEALQLLEDELSRPLSAEETQAARIIVDVIQGNPLQLRQLAALMRDKDLSLVRIAAGLTTPENATALDDQKLTAFAVRSLPKDQRKVALGMAAAGGAPLTQSQIVAISGAQDVSQALVELEKRGLVSQQSGQFSLLGKTAKVINQIVDLTPLKERALDYFIQVAEKETTEAVTAVSEAIQNLAQWAVETNRGAEAVKLVRAADSHLILSKRWDLWREMLGYGREAAQLAADPSNEAWAWHQLGTRAQCLGMKETAKPALIKALRMRNMLGETEAAAVTRHNLDLLIQPPPPPPPPRNPLVPLLQVIAAVILSMSIVVMVVMLFQPEIVTALLATPTPTQQIVLVPGAAMPTQTAQPTSTNIVTATPTVTNTPTPTHTPTVTNTSVPVCRPYQPSGWVAYVVQYGDTLYALATSTGTTMDMIVQANCLDGLIAGSTIWLPPLPPTLTPTPSVTPSPPDLVVSSLTAVVSGDVNSGAGVSRQTAVLQMPTFSMPVTIVVHNQGGQEAAGFRVVVCYGRGEYYSSYSNSTAQRSVAQEVTPCTDFFVEIPLQPNTTVTFNPTFTLPGEWQGYTINIGAEADSCYQERLVAPCRVDESNEENNQAFTDVVLPVVEPVNSPPTVQIVVPEGRAASYQGFDGTTSQQEGGDVPYKYVSLLVITDDEEDGVLPEASVVWSTNQSDILLQQVDLGSGHAIRAQLYPELCSREVQHIVTVTVTDSGGLQATDSVTIILYTGCEGED